MVIPVDPAEVGEVMYDEGLARAGRILDAAGCTRILVDDFSDADLREAVRRAAGRIPLEVSGGVSLERLADIAATGVDYVSVGALTKHVRAIDFSLRLSGPPAATR